MQSCIGAALQAELPPDLFGDVLGKTSGEANVDGREGTGPGDGPASVAVDCDDPVGPAANERATSQIEV